MSYIRFKLSNGLEPIVDLYHDYKTAEDLDALICFLFPDYRENKNPLSLGEPIAYEEFCEGGWLDRYSPCSSLRNALFITQDSREIDNLFVYCGAPSVLTRMRDLEFRKLRDILHYIKHIDVDVDAVLYSDDYLYNFYYNMSFQAV